MVFLTDSHGAVLETNSSSTTLLTGQVFTGTGVDVTNFGTITVFVASDAPSIEQGVSLEFSSNNVDWDFRRGFTYLPPIGDFFNINVHSKYFRVVYTSGGNQSTFRLQTTAAQSKTVNGNGDVFVDFSAKYVDAFNRLRVSFPFTQVDFKTTIDKNLRQISEVIQGGGTSTYLENDSSCLLTVSNNGDRVIRQSRLHAYYEPGKSLVGIATGVLDFGGTNTSGGDVISRIGWYDDQDGFFFEYDGDQLYIVTRKNGVDNPIAQNDWNNDRLDGTGESGYVLDVTKSQIFVMDLQWLGVGTVRMGVFSRGSPIGAQIFFHENTTDGTYIKSANLPIRYEILSNANGQTGTLKTICAAILSEGGSDLKQILGTIGNGVIPRSINSPTPILSIRKRNNNIFFDRSTVNLTLTTLATLNSTPASYTIYHIIDDDGSTLINANWQTSIDDHVEFDVDATSIGLTGSYFPVYGCHLLSKDSINFKEIGTNMPLTSSINISGATGISDIYSLVVEPLNGATGTYLGNFNYNFNE